MQKVYFAVLNEGWLRRELITTVLPAMEHTEGIELVMENPTLTWDHPISSNRNQIVKRFLKTDCDWLLMLDDDVVPFHNPCQMVYANKDIVGSPAKVRQNGRMLNWVVYMKNAHDTGYTPVDLEKQEPTADLLQADVIGTGCILIRRKVLETIKAPFHCEFDEDGILTHGTDFAFCRKATAAGFTIWATRNRWCEHIKENVGLLDMSGYDDIDKVSPDNIPYKIPWGDFSIGGGDWIFLKGVVQEHNVKNILEFGCGLSSLLLSELAEVESFEILDEYAQKIIARATEKNRLTVRAWDGTECTPFKDRYDLAFVDGPKGKSAGGIGRQHSIRIAAQCADMVVIHDAGRPDEMQWQQEYLRDGFALTRWSACHQGRCNLWVRRKEE